MATTPADTPATSPVDEPTVAIPGVADTHAPPDVVLASMVVPASQILAVPVTAAGSGFTGMTPSVKQPATE